MMSTLIEHPYFADDLSGAVTTQAARLDGTVVGTSFLRVFMARAGGEIRAFTGPPGDDHAAQPVWLPIVSVHHGPVAPDEPDDYPGQIETRITVDGEPVPLFYGGDELVTVSSAVSPPAPAPRETSHDD